MLWGVLLWVLVLLTGTTYDADLSAKAQVRAEAHEWRHDPGRYAPACGVGELIARDATETQALIGWLLSPSHFFVLIQRWDRIGYGYHDGFHVVAFVKDCTT